LTLKLNRLICRLLGHDLIILDDSRPAHDAREWTWFCSRCGRMWPHDLKLTGNALASAGEQYMRYQLRHHTQKLRTAR